MLLIVLQTKLTGEALIEKSMANVHNLILSNDISLLKYNNVILFVLFYVPFIYYISVSDSKDNWNGNVFPNMNGIIRETMK